MNINEEVLAAEKRIRPYIHKTPLIKSEALSILTGAKVFFKLENEQHTGSFKARGSLNKLLSLTEKDKEIGNITASTGNHALGFARALDIAKTNGSIYLPANASKSKIAALRKYNVDLIFHGNDCLEAELFAKNRARIENKIWVSPYNDPKIIGGQGTIALELVEQLESFDYVLATVGGGGLISGIGSHLKNVRPNTKIIGCQPELAPEMSMSLKAGKIVKLKEFKETISDGSAGGIEEGAITFPICEAVIDETILVNEQEIINGIKMVWESHQQMIEGAAGVAVASLIQQKEKFKGSTVVIVICGGNIATDKFKKIIQSD